VLVGREPGHVNADLGDDDLSDPLADTRDRQQPGGGLSERAHQPVDLGVETGLHGHKLVDVIEMCSVCGATRLPQERLSISLAAVAHAEAAFE
jgi:hypothetical protein